MERIYIFLPSVLIIGCIAGATALYMRWITKRFGDNLKSVEWQKKNKWKAALTVGTPLYNLWAPTAEELIFRAPLIITFESVSSVAWFWLFVSSGLFAASHWSGKKISVSDILRAEEAGKNESDDVVAEGNRIHIEEGRMILVRKAINVIVSLAIGILTAYYGIKYQSIWVACGIHFAWNLIGPALLQIIVLLVGLTGVFISCLLEAIGWKQTKSY